MSSWLLPDVPFASLDEYVAAGGGAALRDARTRGARWVV